VLLHERNRERERERKKERERERKRESVLQVSLVAHLFLPTSCARDAFVPRRNWSRKFRNFLTTKHFLPAPVFLTRKEKVNKNCCYTWVKMSI
jgi:hypothetical protein